MGKKKNKKKMHSCGKHGKDKCKHCDCGYAEYLDRKKSKSKGKKKK